MQLPEEERVTLDSSSFKALASETRVLILKELDKKRCTASEIAKSLGISVQAASEHLDNLRVAGLVERIDEGRKWIYFNLTEKGRAVLHPDKSKRLWVLLSLFALIIAGSGFMLYNQYSLQNPLAAAQATADLSAFKTAAPTVDSQLFEGESARSESAAWESGVPSVLSANSSSNSTGK
ncbi:winged helix-turn-helix transcriptional regulator [Candidatus Micrarchaeota archaeon]|nr:winged helix-turn-helix transcriptional regulator [Candidatus Micrarchaeota archaeon]